MYTAMDGLLLCLCRKMTGLSHSNNFMHTMFRHVCVSASHWVTLRVSHHHGICRRAKPSNRGSLYWALMIDERCDGRDGDAQFRLALAEICTVIRGYLQSVPSCGCRSTGPRKCPGLLQTDVYQVARTRLLPSSCPGRIHSHSERVVGWAKQNLITTNRMSLPHARLLVLRGWGSKSSYMHTA